jgi:hypothetical protein
MNSKQRRAAKRESKENRESNLNRVERANSPHKETDSRPQRQEKFHITAARMALACVLAVATICGFYIFWPKVSIEPYASLNTQNPFAQLFFVKNESIYPIYDVHSQCETGDTKAAGIDLSHNTVVNRTEFIKRLSPNDRSTFTCHFASLTGMKYETLDINLTVWYSLPLSIRQCRSQHFTGLAAEDSSNSYIWTWRGTQTCFPDRK